MFLSSRKRRANLGAIAAATLISSVALSLNADGLSTAAVPAQKTGEASLAEELDCC